MCRCIALARGGAIHTVYSSLCTTTSGCPGNGIDFKPSATRAGVEASASVHPHRNSDIGSRRERETNRKREIVNISDGRGSTAAEAERALYTADTSLYFRRGRTSLALSFSRHLTDAGKSWFWQCHYALTAGIYANISHFLFSIQFQDYLFRVALCLCIL